MSNYWIYALAGIAVFVMWRLWSSGDRTAVAHREAQIRLPARLAMEVGASFAQMRNAAWRHAFSEALKAYEEADTQWWRMYRRRSGGRKTRMAEARVKAQRHVDQMLDPIEALNELVKMIDETIDA